MKSRIIFYSVLFFMVSANSFSGFAFESFDKNPEYKMSGEPSFLKMPSDVRYNQWLGLQFGRMESALNDSNDGGLFHLLPTIDSAQYTKDRSLEEDRFNGIKGIGFFGDLPAGFSYKLQYGTVDLPVVDGLIRMFSMDPGIRITGVDVDYAYMGRLEWMTPLEGIKLGGAMYNVQMAANSRNEDPASMSYSPPVIDHTEKYRINSIRTSVASTRELTGRLTITAEYVQNVSAALDKEDDKIEQKTGEGYLGGASYQFTNWLELGSYYSIYYADKKDKAGEEWKLKGRSAARAWVKDFALTTRIDINSNWMLKLEGHLVNGLAGADEISDEDWMKIAAEMTIRF